MCIELFGIKIHITAAFAVFFAVTSNLYDGKMYFLSFIFSFVHEAVHILFMRFYGCDNIVLRLSPGGVRLIADGFMTLSHKKSFVCAISAPLNNLFLSASFFFFYKCHGSSLLFDCCTVNLILGASNLLPLSFLDGGRAVFCILSLAVDERKALIISDVLGVLTLIFLFVFCLLSVIKGSYPIFLLFFFFYCIIGSVSDKSR